MESTVGDRAACSEPRKLEGRTAPGALAHAVCAAASLAEACHLRSIEVFYKVLAPDGAGAGAGAKGGGANCKPPGAPADAAEAKADTERLCSVVESQRESIAKLIGKPFRPKAQLLEHAVVVAEATRAVQGAQIEITIARETPVVDAKRVAALGGGDGTLAEHVQQLLAAHEPVALKRALSASGGKLSARVDGKELQLQLGRDFTLSSLA